MTIWAKPHISLTVPNSVNLANLWHLLTKNTKITQNVLKNIILREDIRFVDSHTHNDIDVLFGRLSMALKKESFPTIPVLMKLFMDVETVPTIPHIIEEVSDF